VREIDRRAITDYGLPGGVLMENAGAGTARLLVHTWPDAAVVHVACGRGNNGGDGFVMARHLELLGRSVRIVLAADPSRITGDAAVNLAVARRSGIPVVELAHGDATAWREALAGADVVVDALLGTGAEGPPRGPSAIAIDAINTLARSSSSLGVLAVDLPSGLDCDTGAAAGACVRADVTATYVARKRGFDRPTAVEFTGVVHVVGIGAPRPLLAEFGVGPQTAEHRRGGS
jgi:NAD(P)H-hydrate epimerase